MKIKLLPTFVTIGALGITLGGLVSCKDAKQKSTQQSPSANSEEPALVAETLPVYIVTVNGQG